jgi:hypothetical protein
MENPFENCPYAFQSSNATSVFRQPQILVDMGEDYTSHMAQLSRESCSAIYNRIYDYIHAVFEVNQLFQFAESHQARNLLSHRPDSVAEVLSLLASSPQAMETYFSLRIDSIVPKSEAAEEREEVQAIRDLDGLSALETFVELVALERTRYYRKYLTEQVDQLLMKNQETGLLRQGKGRRNERRWHIGSRLLETLVQIAVLERSGSGSQTTFRSRPILVDDFVRWLRNRYGLVLVPHQPDASIRDYEAYNQNLRQLKSRLREIGFYTDLSDAYNAQVIRPRYSIVREV